MGRMRMGRSHVVSVSLQRVVTQGAASTGLACTWAGVGCSVVSLIMSALHERVLAY